MSEKEKNVTRVRKEDKNFIKEIVSLPPEKKDMIKWILVGMELQEHQRERVVHTA